MKPKTKKVTKKGNDHRIVTTSIGFRPAVLEEIQNHKMVKELSVSVSKTVNYLCEVGLKHDKE